jgi:hypothetical protein
MDSSKAVEPLTAEVLVRFQARVASPRSRPRASGQEASAAGACRASRRVRRANAILRDILTCDDQDRPPPHGLSLAWMRIGKEVRFSLAAETPRRGHGES